MAPNRSRDHAFDLGRRETTDTSGPFGLTLEQGGGQIVAVLDASFADVARRHAVAAVVKDPPGQQGLGLHSRGLMIVHLFGELGLHGLEQAPVDNGRLLPCQNLALEFDLADVEAVAEQVGKRTAREWDATDLHS